MNSYGILNLPQPIIDHCLLLTDAGNKQLYVVDELGSTVSSFAFDGEKFMVVGHKMFNEIQIYSFDREKCTLTPVGKPIECWRPLCFKFI